MGAEVTWVQKYQPGPKGDAPLPPHLIRNTLLKKRKTIDRVDSSPPFAEVHSSKSYKEHVKRLDPCLEKERLEYAKHWPIGTPLPMSLDTYLHT